MPIHDWTTRYAGEFHAFHNAWITELQRALNSGILPSDYYALGEQRAGEIGPDVLTLHSNRTNGSPQAPASSDRGKVITVAERPPQTRIMQTAPDDTVYYLAKHRAVVIRHVTGDQVVAVIEIMSPANKQARTFFEAFLNKALTSLAHGCHLLIVDVLPPGNQDPQGIHGQIWEAMTGEGFELPSPQARTMASYCAATPPLAYVELPSVGDELPQMPLFLSIEEYVRVPLEETYQGAWTSMPIHLRHALTR